MRNPNCFFFSNVALLFLPQVSECFLPQKQYFLVHDMMCCCYYPPTESSWTNKQLRRRRHNTIHGRYSEASVYRYRYQKKCQVSVNIVFVSDRRVKLVSAASFSFVHQSLYYLSTLYYEFKVTVYLQRCLASKRCSAPALNCRIPKPLYHIKAYRAGYQTIPRIL